MKFQDSSFNGLKVTVGTKSVTHARTHARTHAPKAICPINFFKVGGIMNMRRPVKFLFLRTCESQYADYGESKKTLRQNAHAIYSNISRL